ncbi:hypothetical protein [Streptomyces sp. NPDC056399]|uniref:hypothetical protein n=1 Tax=Streptomyces sp. NPDC056399 TaxID=3345807 RepID=UPI0035E1E7FD
MRRCRTTVLNVMLSRPAFGLGAAETGRSLGPVLAAAALRGVHTVRRLLPQPHGAGT